MIILLTIIILVFACVSEPETTTIENTINENNTTEENVIMTDIIPSESIMIHQIIK